MKRLLVALFVAVLASGAAQAAEEGYRLDRAPIDPTDLVSLQAGARTFSNYCLSCHSAEYMRYNRLTDIGLTTDQIRDNLMFASDKVGDTMKVALSAPRARATTVRSGGADWLYT